MKKKKAIKKYKDDEGNVFKPHAFMVEDHHPVVGRILVVDGRKYKILDDYPDKRKGTFIKPMTEEDEAMIEEYDNEVEQLSEMLIQKVDIKKMIKEQIKNKPYQDIKTGLFILKKEEEGEKIEIEHHKGCYHFKLQYKNLEFDFASGDNVVDSSNIEFR